MKGFILTLNKTAYKNAYTLNFRTLYTPAKLVIPKKDGKPTLNGTWYVYYRYRNPNTGVLDKFELKQGINRLETISERTKAGNNLKKAINRILQDGIVCKFEDINPLISVSFFICKPKSFNLSMFFKHPSKASSNSYNSFR